MFEWLRESTWGYPIIGAIHVLSLAWFGGTVLIEDGRLLAWKRIGLILVLLSGGLLFGLHAGRYASSTAFQIKVLLLLSLVLRLPRPLSLARWVAIIFAARFTAFF